MMKDLRLEIVQVGEEYEPHHFRNTTVEIRISNPKRLKLILLTSFDIDPILAFATKYIWSRYPYRREELIRVLEKNDIKELERFVRYSFPPVSIIPRD